MQNITRNKLNYIKLYNISWWNLRWQKMCSVLRRSIIHNNLNQCNPKILFNCIAVESFQSLYPTTFKTMYFSLESWLTQLFTKIYCTGAVKPNVLLRMISSGEKLTFRQLFKNNLSILVKGLLSRKLAFEPPFSRLYRIPPQVPDEKPPF